jgi:predicted dehydrogenase
MAKKKVRIGFVGVGDTGQCAHLKDYDTVPDCEVVAIADPRKDLATKIAARYGVGSVYKTHQEMIKKERLDGIVASQQFGRHGVLVPELLRAGVPVFIEKPLAGSIEVGEKIVKAVKDSKTWIMVGYHKRSDPATMYAKEEIVKLKKSGELGELKYARIIMPTGDWVAGGINDPIRGEGESPKLEWDPQASDMDKATFEAYTSFVNCYIHQINLMRHLLGESYHVKYADPSGVVLAGQSKSGVACVIEMTPYSTSVDWQESALISFEYGYVKLELPAALAENRPGRVEILKDPRKDGVTPQTIVPQLPRVHAMRQQAMNFVSAIRGDMKPMCAAEEALDDLKVAREYLKLWKGV